MGISEFTWNCFLRFKAVVTAMHFTWYFWGSLHAHLQKHTIRLQNIIDSSFRSTESNHEDTCQGRISAGGGHPGGSGSCPEGAGGCSGASRPRSGPRGGRPGPRRGPDAAGGAGHSAHPRQWRGVRANDPGRRPQRLVGVQRLSLGLFMLVEVAEVETKAVWEYVRVRIQESVEL